MAELLQQLVTMQAERRPNAIRPGDRLVERISYPSLQGPSTNWRGSCKPSAAFVATACAFYAQIARRHHYRTGNSQSRSHLRSAGPLQPSAALGQDHCRRSPRVPLRRGIGGGVVARRAGRGELAPVAVDWFVGRRAGRPAENPVLPERFGGVLRRAARLSKSPSQAHILFTSGSTGAPKGVQITHDNALRFIEWAIRYFGASPGDRISGQPPLHFDLSTFDIYATLGAGAQLHLVPVESENLFPNNIADFSRRHEAERSGFLRLRC